MKKYRYLSTQVYNSSELQSIWNNKQLRKLLKDAGISSPDKCIKIRIEIEDDREIFPYSCDENC